MGKPREKSWNFHTCKLCPYRSKLTFLMYKHGRLHRKKSKSEEKDVFSCHSKTPEMLECQLCGFDTDVKVDLKEHLSVIHEEKQVNGKQENILECYQCKNCVFETYSVLVLTKHVDDCHIGDHLQQKDMFPIIKTKNPNDLHVVSTEKLENSEDEDVDVTEPCEVFCSNDMSPLSTTKDLVSMEKLESSKNEDVTQPCEVISSNDMFPTITTENTDEKFESSEDTTELCKVTRSNADEVLIKEILNKKLTVVLTRIEIDPTENNSSGTKKKFGPKKNCCFYCKKLFVKIPIHLESRHSDQEEVKKIVNLPKGCSERKKIIEKLRRLGNFEYNNSKDCKEMITCRRLQGRKTNTCYAPCANCKGYFSKCALRKHFRKCASKQDRKKNVLILSRKLEYNLLEGACTRLKTVILPVLRSEVAETIINDPFLILYANSLCFKYGITPHIDGVIRTILRTLVKLFAEMRNTYSQITYFEQVFGPDYFKGISNAVDKLGKKDAKSGVYEVPTTALNLGIWFKQSVQFYIMHCIRKQKFEESGQAEILLRLLREKLADVNKTVVQKKKIVYISMKMGANLPNTKL